MKYCLQYDIRGKNITRFVSIPAPTEKDEQEKLDRVYWTLQQDNPVVREE